MRAARALGLLVLLAAASAAATLGGVALMRPEALSGLFGGRDAAPSAGREAAPDARLELDIVPRARRDVTPPGVTPGPEVVGPLVRAPAPAAPAPPQEAEPRKEKLFKPVALSATEIRLGEEGVRLAGLQPLDPAATCGEGRSAWPCGRMALTALQRFLRGRAIDCEIPPAKGKPAAMTCRLGKQDIAEWLAAQGWAKPEGEAYAAAGAAAKAASRGVWSPERPKLGG